MPTSVRITAKSPAGPLDVVLQVKAEDVVEGELVHTLAARALITDLSDGTSWLHNTLSSSSPPSSGEAKKEMVRLGIRYGLVSEHTSYIAIQNGSPLEEMQAMLRNNTRFQIESQRERYRCLSNAPPQTPYQHAIPTIGFNDAQPQSAQQPPPMNRYCSSIGVTQNDMFHNDMLYSLGNRSESLSLDVDSELKQSGQLLDCIDSADVQICRVQSCQSKGLMSGLFSGFSRSFSSQSAPKRSAPKKKSARVSDSSSHSSSPGLFSSFNVFGSSSSAPPLPPLAPSCALPPPCGGLPPFQPACEGMRQSLMNAAAPPPMSTSMPMTPPPPPPASMPRKHVYPMSHMQQQQQQRSKTQFGDLDPFAPTPSTQRPKSEPANASAQLQQLISCQHFSGYFHPAQVSTLTNVPMARMTEAAATIAVTLGEETALRVIATTIAVEFMHDRLADLACEWQLIEAKAKKWMMRVTTEPVVMLQQIAQTLLVGH